MAAPEGPSRHASMLPPDEPLVGVNPDELRREGVADWLIEQLASKARGDRHALEGLLVEVGDCVQIGQTRTRSRCHFVARDGLGRPRIDALVRKLVRQVRDFCIPRSRIAEAVAHLQSTGSTEKFSQLDEEARELFVHLDSSGEGGELLLYVLLERVLGLPQLLCKMPLKTSTQMHVHGTDGVHGKVLPNGNLALYWGESKLHAPVGKAIDECFASIAPFLSDVEGGAARRDLLLVRDHVDPGDEVVRKALVRYFDDDTAESGKLEVRGACLVGFDLNDYPEPLGADGRELREEVAEHLENWRARTQARVGEHRLEAFEIEVFCVPFPSVGAFRRQLGERLRFR